MLSCPVKLAGKYSYLAPKFMAGVKWLAETDFTELSDGKHPISDSDLVADIQTYTTKPASECRFESHHEHFDIQYVAEGREHFCVCPVDGLKVTEAHTERDTYFYENPENASCVLLNQGDFIIVTPEEAHMPKVCVKDPEKVRKVVIKVKA